MRTIKFRTWDREKKRFAYLTIHPNQIGFSSPLWTKLHGQYNGNDLLEGVFFENIDGWQEFTGLHDKNGVEIFEDDIVMHHWHKQACIARWSESRSQFELGFGKDWYPLWPIDNKQFEVLGNVHENPELVTP